MSPKYKYANAARILTFLKGTYGCILFQIHYPMELHLVHKNNDLGTTFGDVVKKQANNSLAVLGIMFELQKEDNPKLEPLVKGKDLYLNHRRTKANLGWVYSPPLTSDPCPTRI